MDRGKANKVEKEQDKVKKFTECKDMEEGNNIEMYKVKIKRKRKGERARERKKEKE